MAGSETVRLRDIAGVIRSKNAGPYELTFDIIFNDYETFEKAVRGNSVTKELFSLLYGIPVVDVFSVIPFPPAKAIKITILRPRPSGSLGETDVYGAQQHGPLLDLEVVLA
ncbi:MAG: DUF4387 domain-containing protein [Dethiobacter sp.]|jgi:hypothetical protein|nr:DUF4387 domain-containing protein [Dethiobacter sp.]